MIIFLFPRLSYLIKLASQLQILHWFHFYRLNQLQKIKITFKLIFNLFLSLIFNFLYLYFLQIKLRLFQIQSTHLIDRSENLQCERFQLKFSFFIQLMLVVLTYFNPYLLVASFVQNDLLKLYLLTLILDLQILLSLHNSIS